METTVKTLKINLLSMLFLVVLNTSLHAQYCDSLVPSFTVDLSAAPNMGWVSPPIVRDGNCCGTSSPDNCLEFIITLNANAIAIEFNIASGAIPPGALFYQVDCGPQVAVGDPICLNGPGPHHLTFCKPGNNANTFSITSYSEPIIGPDITINAGCQNFIYAQYYDESTITWTSVFPGIQGTYDNLLSCQTGCDTSYIVAPMIGPAYIDYLVCGMDIGSCNPNPICDTIRVFLIPPVSVDVQTPDAYLCVGELTTVVANVSGGTAPYAIQWSNGSNQLSQTVAGGNYIATVTDASGCIVASDSVLINEYAVVVNAGPDIVVCEGESVTVQATGAVVYSWSGGLINGVPFVPAVGQHWFVVTGSGINNCTDNDALLVTVNANPDVVAGPDQSLCETERVTLNATGSPHLEWSNGVINNVPFDQSVGTVMYFVYDTLPNGCFDVDSLIVTILPNPVVETSDKTICEGEGVALEATGAVSYVWEPSIGNGVTFYPLTGGVYTVIGTAANGCVDSATAFLTVNSNPIADFSITNPELSTSVPGTNFNNLSSNANSYLWDFGDGSGTSSQFEPYHEFNAEEGASYFVSLTATSVEGCVDVIEKLIVVKQDYSLFVPNTFTPDANGVNEIFFPVLYGFDEQDFVMYIYNRWGEIVFETHNTEIGWDGSYAGKYEQVQDGTYTWKIEARVKNTTETMSFIGHINVIK